MIRKLKLTSSQFIALGYLITILIGSFFLSLPIASKSGAWTPYINSLFTATSATCVTGLIIYDTFLHWSIFGQITILLLIQIGGIGFMTIITLFGMFFKKRIGLHERKLIMHSAGSLKISGVVHLIKKIAIGTLIFETVGAILLAIRFCPDMGFGQGVYNAVFHSISAFCNAGFDLMGKYGAFSSLIKYQNDIIVNFTIMLLVLIGGIGFIVWNDIIVFKFKIKNFQLHSKMVLSITAFLVCASALLFFLFERNYSMNEFSTGQAVMASFFQAITPRTAGFSTIDISSLSNSGSTLTMLLMFIGGSPGSTAGGIKTTTFMVVILGIVATTRHTRHINIFKYSLEENIVRQAGAIVAMYMLAITVATMIISASQVFTFKDTIFEVVSAVGTVGLSAGITSQLNVLSKIVIMLLMYGGRVGIMSLVLVFAERNECVPLSRPIKKVIIG